MSVTLSAALERMNDNHIGPALRAVGLHRMVEPTVKAVVAQTAAATVTLDPPALCVQSVRVSGGAIASGDYGVTDPGGTARACAAGVPGLCKLSADGVTLTFNGNVTDATIVYVARTKSALSSILAGLM